MAVLTAFAMRVLGTPVTIDFTPQWINSDTGHSWNFVCDCLGRHISFMGTQSNSGMPHQGNTLLKSKAYGGRLPKNFNYFGFQDIFCNFVPVFIYKYKLKEYEANNNQHITADILLLPNVLHREKCEQ
jgi:hypothetical protein